MDTRSQMGMLAASTMCRRGFRVCLCAHLPLTTRLKAEAGCPPQNDCGRANPNQAVSSQVAQAAEAEGLLQWDTT